MAALVRSAYRGEESRAGWTTEADLVADDRVDVAGVTAKITDPAGLVLLAGNAADPLLGCCELVDRTSAGAGGRDEVAYFGMFAVRPVRQGAGLGRALLAEAEAEVVRRWGATSLEMTVIAHRTELIAWYGRRGYTLTGETRPFPYGDLVGGPALRDDLYFVVLRKPLLPAGR